jgi:hypothetical protein
MDRWGFFRAIGHTFVRYAFKHAAFGMVRISRILQQPTLMIRSRMFSLGSLLPLKADIP